MPIYNGSQYLERSIGSVVAQTYTEWQLVALDDGSTDDSRAVLQRLAATDSRIKIMTKTNDGKGNTARNIDVMKREAKGDYIFYMSQDDYISADLLQNAVTRAETTGAEVVIPDMLLANADGSCDEIACSHAPNNDYSTLLRGAEAFYQSIDFAIHGFALIHRSLMFAEDNDTRFFDSDEYNTRVQYLHAQTVAFCHGTFYYYQGNAEAMTKKFAPRQFQRLNTATLLGAKAWQEGVDQRTKEKIRRWQMQTYLNVLILFFNNAKAMNTEQYAETVARFECFEREVAFDGYRLSTLKGLGKAEKMLALCYFAFGNCRCLQPLHKAYKR